jgi:hypothetical protein
LFAAAPRMAGTVRLFGHATEGSENGGLAAGRLARIDLPLSSGVGAQIGSVRHG